MRSLVYAFVVVTVFVSAILLWGLSAIREAAITDMDVPELSLVDFYDRTWLKIPNVVEITATGDPLETIEILTDPAVVVIVNGVECE